VFESQFFRVFINKKILEFIMKRKLGDKLIKDVKVLLIFGARNDS
jgi:hypothetical protein